MNSPVWTRPSVARLAAAAWPVPAAASLAGPGVTRPTQPGPGPAFPGALSVSAALRYISLIGGARHFNYLTAAI